MDRPEFTFMLDIPYLGLIETGIVPSIVPPGTILEDSVLGRKWRESLVKEEPATGRNELYGTVRDAVVV